MYVTAKTVRSHYEISHSGLRKWALEGKVSYKQLPGGNRLYSIDDIHRIFGGKRQETKEKVIYARVSSSHQKEDLDRQIEDLKQAYPNHRIIYDVASGLNFSRKGLQALLDGVFDRTIQEVVVAYRDRLCRFGFELFESVFKRFEVRLVVHNKSTDHSTSNPELAEDLLAVVNFFVARNNGKRSSENRKRRRVHPHDIEEDQTSTQQETA